MKTKKVKERGRRSGDVIPTYIGNRFDGRPLARQLPATQIFSNISDCFASRFLKHPSA